jgi:hypothetical protein
VRAPALPRQHWDQKALADPTKKTKLATVTGALRPNLQKQSMAGIWSVTLGGKVAAERPLMP